MIDETIDYEGMFKQLRHENENLRLYIVKLKNLTPSLIDCIKEGINEFLSDEDNSRIVYTILLLATLSLIIPAIKTIAISAFRRITHEG